MNPQKPDGDIRWFVHDRFGMLIHLASEIRWRKTKETGLLGDMDIGIPDDALVRELPFVKPDAVVPVVELLLKD